MAILLVAGAKLTMDRMEEYGADGPNERYAIELFNPVLVLVVRFIELTASGLTNPRTPGEQLCNSSASSRELYGCFNRDEALLDSEKEPLLIE